jgi:cytoskeletal protein CcmA (bactofilin family)
VNGSHPVVFRRSKGQEESVTGEPQRNRLPAESIIGAGMVLHGDCEAPGGLRVDGHVTGNVRAERLTVGAGGRIGGDATAETSGSSGPAQVLVQGRVDGTVRAPRLEIGAEGSVGGGIEVGEAVVGGQITGTIVSRDRLLLEATAVVEGDVTARRLALTEGARLSGGIRVGEDAPSPVSSP